MELSFPWAGAVEGKPPWQVVCWVVFRDVAWGQLSSAAPRSSGPWVRVYPQVPRGALCVCHRTDVLRAAFSLLGPK